MKIVPEIFKTDIRTYGRQIDIKMKVNDVEFSSDNINYVKPSVNEDLFKTIMQKIELDVKEALTIDSKVDISVGVKVNQKTYNYVNYNSFYVFSCERQEDTNSYRVILYTKMKDAMVDYNLAINENITVRNYLVAICEKLGWNTDNIPDSFINSTKLVNPILHTGIGYTYRDALDEIATITCSSILFLDGKLYLKYFNVTNEIIDDTYLDEDNTTLGDKYIINALVFGRAEESDNIFRKDDESIEVNGLHEFRIADNQLLSTNDRSDYIDEMYNYLKTLELYTFDIQTKGILFFDPCDLFLVQFNGTKYPVIVLNDEISIEDGISESLYFDKPEETVTKYKYGDSTDKKINQLFILADKQAGKITMLSSSVENVNSTANEALNNTNVTNTTEEAKEFHLTDSADSNCKSAEIFGESKQETRSGKNLLNPNLPVDSKTSSGITVVNNGDGTYTATGTSTAAMAIALTQLNTIKLKSNTAYTNSIEILNGTMEGFIAVSVYNDNNKITYNYINLDANNLSRTKTSTENLTINSYDYYVNAAGITVDFTFRVQLEEGAEATAYEPYGAMPSPEFPSEIESVTSPVTIKSAGKNLILFPYYTESTTKSGVSFAINEDGSIIANGTATDDNNFYLIRNGVGTIPLKKGKYTYSGVTDGSSTTYYLQAYKNGKPQAVNATTPVTINAEDGDEITGLAIFFNSGTVFNNVIIKPQLEFGNEATAYEPYKESITAIPLLHDMRSLPNRTRDRIYYKDGKWYDEQKVINEPLGTGFSKYGSLNVYYKKFENLKGYSLLSNYFKYMYVGDMDIEDGTMTTFGQQYVYFKKDDITTKAEFEEWAKNVYLQYELAEPIITEITDGATITALESIKTYKGITNITADANCMLTYYRDVPIVDEYETKADANKKQELTIEKFADLELTDEQIKLEVGKRVGKDEIISSINMSDESATIKSDKISLERQKNRFNSRRNYYRK